MSFIRCSSNPEGLYVIHNINDNMDFFYDFGENGSPSVSCPAKDFYHFARKKVKDPFNVTYDKIEYKNISVREIRVFDDDNSIVPKKYDAFKEYFKNPKKKHRQTNHKIMLQIGKKKMYLWQVTWVYFMNNVLSR